MLRISGGWPPTSESPSTTAWLHSAKKVRRQSVIIIHKVQDISLQLTGSWSQPQHLKRCQHWQECHLKIFKRIDLLLKIFEFLLNHWGSNNIPPFFYIFGLFAHLNIYNVKYIWVCFLLDFYNLILPFQKRISMNLEEKNWITRNPTLHWKVTRNIWMQHRPKMSSFSKRTRTFIKGKRFFLTVVKYFIWIRVSGKSLFYENFSFKSDPNEFETRRRKTEERKLLRALVNDFTNTIV